MIDRASLVLAILPVPFLALRGCGDPPAAYPPSIASDGTTFTVAWDGDGPRDMRAIYTQQFDARGKPLDDARTVYRDAGLRGAASIVRVGDGYLALATWHSRDMEKDYTNQLLAVPLDAQARSLDDARVQWLGDVVCANPVVDGDRVLVGIRIHPTDHRHPQDLFAVYSLDAHGRELGLTVVSSSSPGGCGTALHDGKLAFAHSYVVREGDAYVRKIYVQLDALHGRDGVTLRTSYAGHRGISLVPIGDEWALLGETDDDAAPHRGTVWRFGADGVHSVVTLPERVDLDSAALSATDRGLFVTWISGSDTRILDVASSAIVRTKSAGFTPSGTTALGTGDRCVAGWTNRDGAHAQLLIANSCP